MLIEQLRELCDYGMVSKTSYEGYPLKVEYSLTRRGLRCWKQWSSCRESESR